MSEDAWRRKRYYNPRVVIGTADILDCPFPDSLVCLTGAELALLRNMTQYLHRRSTFASAYHEGYYLAPTNEEWDALDAIVAGLEDKLMGCPDLLTMLEDILAAAQCACEGASPGYIEPYLVNYYDDLADDGTVIYELPDGTPEPPIDDRCAVAQLVWAYQYEFLVETLQPAQEFLHTVLLAGVLGLIGTAIGGPVLGMSAAAVSAFITALLDMGVKSDLFNVENELVSLKWDLVCAMYMVFDEGGTYTDATAAAAAVIDDSTEWSPIDKLLFKRGFSPDFMAKAQEAWTAQTAWATGNVTAGYCDLCQYGPPTQEYWATAPPCPGVMTLSGGAYCKDGYWTVAGSNDQHITTPIRRVLAGSYGFQGHYDLKSETPAGWGVGDMRALRSYNLQDWVQVYNRPVGFIGQNVWTEVWGASDPVTFTSEAYVYMYWTGQAGQSSYEKFYRGLGWKVTPT